MVMSEPWTPPRDYGWAWPLLLFVALIVWMSGRIGHVTRTQWLLSAGIGGTIGMIIGIVRVYRRHRQHRTL